MLTAHKKHFGVINCLIIIHTLTILSGCSQPFIRANKDEPHIKKVVFNTLVGYNPDGKKSTQTESRQTAKNNIPETDISVIQEKARNLSLPMSKEEFITKCGLDHFKEVIIVNRGDLENYTSTLLIGNKKIMTLRRNILRVKDIEEIIEFHGSTEFEKLLPPSP
jgi:hypothetical protein